MKNRIFQVVILGISFMCFTKVHAQELQFQYDPAGNQTERKFVCINCSTFPVSLASAPPLPGDSTVAIIDPKKTASVTTRKIMAYPNPLTEVLNLKWENGINYYINKIEVYSSKGTTFFQQDLINGEILSRDFSIPFTKQIPGMYFIRATYSDGKQQIIKVIKIDR